MSVPVTPRIYHIVHVDRLASIIADKALWCDAEILRRRSPGTTIGMNTIKQRRLTELTLTCHPDLFVGGCVPFYFCPRSIMLFLLHKGNHDELTYRGGQGPIIHLEANLFQVVEWAAQNRFRWAFTTSNAGARYVEHLCDLGQLSEVDWKAVAATSWQNCKEGKQAEFLVEHKFPWQLVERIGVSSRQIYDQARAAVEASAHKPRVEIKREWYY